MRRSYLCLGLWSVLSCAPAKLPEPAAAAARLELSPAALLLPALGDTAHFSVRAFDAQGNVVPAPEVSFSVVGTAAGVSADGTVNATAFGSSRVTVSAGSLSASATALVAAPIAGAVLVSDAQVIGAFRPLDPAAQIDVGYRYDVTLRGVTPAVGGVVVGTGELPVGGRVVAVSGEVVTLEVVPLDELFVDLRLDETIELKQAPLEFNPAVREAFDVELTPEGGVRLSLKPGTELSADVRKKTRAPGAAELEFTLGPLDCVVEASVFQLSLAKLDISLDPGLTVERVFDAAHKRVVVKSNAKAAISIKPVLQSQLEGKLSCDLEIGKAYIPLPGPVGLVLGFSVPFGVGFAVEAKQPFLAGVGVEFKRELTATAEAGVDCKPTCAPVGDFQNTSKPALGAATPSLSLALPTALKVEAGIGVYAFAKVTFGGSQIINAASGATGFRRLEAELVVVKVGLKLEGKFATQEAQAGDPAFNGNYRIAFEAGLESGKAINSLFNLLKVPVVKLEVKITQDLATSPKGTLTVDKPTYRQNDELTFTATFTPDSLDFPFIGFNAQKVLVYQKGSTGPDPVLTFVAEVPVNHGQSVVTMVALAPKDGVADDFVAFVETGFLSALSCELANPNDAPRVQMSLLAYNLAAPGSEGSFLSENAAAGYDCSMDKEIYARSSERLMADTQLPTTMTAGGSRFDVVEQSPGVFVVSFTGRLPGPVAGMCGNGGNFSFQSDASGRVAFFVTPLEAGSFELGGDQIVSHRRWAFADRAAWNAGVATVEAPQVSPARNSFDAGVPFVIGFSSQQFTSAGAPYMNRAWATLKFTK